MRRTRAPIRPALSFEPTGLMIFVKLAALALVSLPINAIYLRVSPREALGLDAAVARFFL